MLTAFTLGVGSVSYCQSKPIHIYLNSVIMKIQTSADGYYSDLLFKTQLKY